MPLGMHLTFNTLRGHDFLGRSNFLVCVLISGNKFGGLRIYVAKISEINHTKRRINHTTHGL
jgi:hypothetical protein